MKRSYLIAFLLLAIAIAFFAKSNIAGLIRFPMEIFTKSIRTVYTLAVFKNRYEERISALQKEAAYLSSIAAGKKEAAEENQRLRALLALRARHPSKSVAAEVIGRSMSGLNSFVIIDKGAPEGITAGMAVIKEEGLLGRISEVGGTVSKALLLDDPNSRISAAAQRTREQGLVVGIGGGLCRMIYLPAETDVKPDDIVVASQSSEISPHGVLIGRVEKVDREPNNLYSSAIVRPAVSLYRVEEVLCVE